MIKINFLTLVGSQLYGFANEKSDFDYKGFGTMDPEYILGLHNIKTQQIEIKEPEKNAETVIFDVRKYMKLSLTGNPTLLEMAFAEQKYHVECDDVGREVTSLVRDQLVTKWIALPYEKYITEQIKRTRRDVEGKRLELVNAHGYDTKCATHIVRLSYQAIDLLSNGWFNPTMQGEQLAQCKAIKAGEISGKEFVSLAESLDKMFKSAYNNSRLPEKHNEQLVENVLMRIQFENLLKRKDEYNYAN